VTDSTAFLWFADLVVLLHLCFILFVLFGGLLCLKWRWMPWLHLPAALWGALVEFNGWICPLTPLENWLRQSAEVAGYEGGFVERYLLPVMYPAGLTQSFQIVLGVIVVVLNLIVYLRVWRRTRIQR